MAIYQRADRADLGILVRYASFRIRLRRPVLVIKNAFGRTVQVLVLSTFQTPKKKDETRQAECQRNWDQIEEVPHSTSRLDGNFSARMLGLSYRRLTLEPKCVGDNDNG